MTKASKCTPACAELAGTVEVTLFHFQCVLGGLICHGVWDSSPVDSSPGLWQLLCWAVLQRKVRTQRVNYQNDKL